MICLSFTHAKYTSNQFTATCMLDSFPLLHSVFAVPCLLEIQTLLLYQHGHVIDKKNYEKNTTESSETQENTWNLKK